MLRYNDSTADGTGTNTDSGFWEATDNGIDYYQLNSTEGFRLEDDPDPHLGGNLVVNNFAITSIQDIPNGDNGNIVIDSDNDIIIDATKQIKANTPIGLQEVLLDPAFVAGYNTIYGKAIGSGGTGLYVRNQDRVEELVSRSKAIVFGLIF